MDDEELEQTLFVHRQCDVYRLPTAPSNRGHFAGDWKDKIFSGRIRVTAKGDTAFINIEDPNTGDLFVTAPIRVGEEAVQPVVDSSRYFVLKVDDGKGHHAFLGMGFLDRGPAFDFNVAIQDHKKWASRQKVIEEERKNTPETDFAPSDKFAMKQGETISVKLNVNKNKPVAAASAGGLAALSGPPGLLAPPGNTSGSSSARDARKARSGAKPTPSAPAPGGSKPADAFDFGDFAAVPPVAQQSQPQQSASLGFDDFGDFSAPAPAQPQAAKPQQSGSTDFDWAF